MDFPLYFYTIARRPVRSEGRGGPLSGSRRLHRRVVVLRPVPGRRAAGAQDLQIGCLFWPSAIHCSRRPTVSAIFFNMSDSLPGVPFALPAESGQLYPAAGVFTGFGHFADHPGFFTAAGEAVEHVLGVLLGDHRHKTDAVVEGPHHLFFLHIAGGLQKGEDGRPFPGIAMDADAAGLGDDPDDVVHDATTGDMGQTLDGQVAYQMLDGLGIDSRRRDQLLAQGFSQLGHMTLHRESQDVKADFAHQGKSVAVQTAGGNAHQLMAGADLRAVNDLGIVHNTYGKAGQIVFIVLVEPRHFGGFAADQGTVGLDATVADALDDGGDGFTFQLAGRQVVEEKEGSGPLHGNIVDAHGHQVDAHRVMAIHQKGDFELGPHAVRGTDQDRAFHVGGVQRKQAAEAANFTHDTGPTGFLGNLFDGVDKVVRRVDVDAGIGVGQFSLHSGTPGFYSAGLQLCVKII
ncbi:conserved hypothetical protein [Desulfosarcina cetonica]|nr:conserved hypothetical protein [Desulfosarcina cetonica]